MRIRCGYNIEIICQEELQFTTLLDVHPSRRADLLTPDDMTVTSLRNPALKVPTRRHLDAFGNICRRITAPPGGIALRAESIVHDAGEFDPVDPFAGAVPPSRLPDDALVYLLGSRYCETDLLAGKAWSLFGQVPPGWQRVQAIVDLVHNHLAFGYDFARCTRSAAEAFEERVGVCRDFAHLAITLCRCVNVPARYCNGYLGDIGVPPNPAPMDFNAWFEAFIGGRWYTFDARHNRRRIGRIVIARGRDATDVAMLSSFGPHTLQRFEVITEEVEDPQSWAPVQMDGANSRFSTAASP